VDALTAAIEALEMAPELAMERDQAQEAVRAALAQANRLREDLLQLREDTLGRHR
jgi:predicted nucleotide-binding protein (sugar kinase/HSP70/actin superfamily)